MGRIGQLAAIHMNSGTCAPAHSLVYLATSSWRTHLPRASMNHRINRRLFDKRHFIGQRTAMSSPGTEPPASHSHEAVIRGPFSFNEKARRAAWYLVEATLFRHSFRRADRWRSFLLRLFGARIGKRCLIRRTVNIEIPWNLSVGDDVMLGEHAIIYSLGAIEIGHRSIVSQYAHLCAGSHDHLTQEMTLLRMPISIGADAWIAADAFVGPGVSVEDGVVLGARSSAFSDLPKWTICVGTPAKPVNTRTLESLTEISEK